MAKMFTKEVFKKPPRSSFNLSYSNKFTTHFGYIYPVFLQECLPGDKFNISAQCVGRTIPLVAPILDNINVQVRYFFVPNRLLDSDWEDLINKGKDGDQSVVLDNYYQYARDELGSLIDPTSLLTDNTIYRAFGLDCKPLPNDEAPDPTLFYVSPLPFRAYNKIYNDYYRDENLEDEIHLDSYKLQTCYWTKNDYFTSALPFAQRGTMPVLNFEGQVELEALDGLKLQGNPSSVKLGATDLTADDLYNGYIAWNGTGASQTNAYNFLPDGAPSDKAHFSIFTSAGSNGDTGINIDGCVDNDILYNGRLPYDTEGSSRKIYNSYSVANINASEITNNIFGNLSSVGVSAEELRYLLATQEFMERQARAGSRYTEYVYANFGVFAGDARLDRSEYLGGFKSQFVVGDIPQTSAQYSSGELVGSPVGTLSGKGACAFSGFVKPYFCKEHGWLLGLMTITPRLSWINKGVDKKFRKNKFFDFYQPEYSHLGEQPIYKGEMFISNKDNGKISEACYDVFGYQGIYAEYRHNNDIVTADFARNYSSWTMARELASVPTLNKTLMKINPSDSYLNNIFAVSSQNPFIINIYNNVRASRLLPTYATPSSLVI